VLHGARTGQALPAFASDLEDLSSLSPTTLPWLARLLVERGQLDEAVPLLQKLEMATGPALQPRHLAGRLVRLYHQVMAGITQHDAATLRAAEAEAGALTELAERLDWAGYLSEVLALRALAEFRRRALPLALADLERALALAERDGQVMVFVGKGRPMAELLAEALRQGLEHAAYAQTVLDRFPSPPALSQPVSQAGLAEPLTEREIEVLRLMADGLTYEAMAQRLFVSVNTVRYHVKNLYGKLGTGSRAAAIARGRELHVV
jgi:ATP/maltotriose-dependent transcriptional regulator MalT